MKILFLSRWFPYPANNGSKLRIYNLLSGLSEHHDLTLLSFVDPAEITTDTRALKEICSEVYTIPWREYNPKSRRSRLGLLSSVPRFLLDTHSTQMETQIRHLLANGKYDLIIASQIAMASYHKAFGRIPAVYEEVELGSFYEQAHFERNAVKRLRSLLTWLKLKAYFSRMLNAFAVCTVASLEEQLIFSHAFPEHKQKAVVVPNCIDLKEYQISGVERKFHHIIFSGSFRYTANYYAMVWFLEKAYPLVLKNVTDTKLLITGDHGDLPLPMTQNVHRTGHVDDIKSLIAACDVSIVPIWSGGGTRLKILEAMAVGTPVVSTSKGAQGLLAVNGKNILIADEPESFAAQITQLLLDKEFGNQIAANAFRLVKEQYDWVQVLPQYLQMIDKVTMGSS